MAYTTETLAFTSDDFNLLKPELTDGLIGATTGIRYATKKLTLDLGSNDYRYVKFKIDIPVGNVDYCSVNFVGQNGLPVSVGTPVINPSDEYLYTISSLDLVLENIVKDNSFGETITPPKEYNVIVNGSNLDGDQLYTSEYLDIYINVAAVIMPESVSVTVEYDCSLSLNLYEYEVGVHVYSEYDSIFNPKLTTKLYSLHPINNWVEGTKVFSSPFLNNPALPYSYGYGSYVYKVGGELDRAFGTKFSYKIRKRFLKKGYDVKISTKIQNTFNSNLQTSLACIEPIINDVGVVKKITLNSNLTQPQKYRYYLGYSNNIKQESNDGVFTQYSLGREQHDPITGAMHALNKLASTIISGYDINMSTLGAAAIVMVAGLSLLIPGVSAFFANTIGIYAGHLFNYLIGPLIPKFLGGLLNSPLGFSMAWAPWFFGAIMVLGFAYMVFQIYQTREVEEDCKIFLHHFTNTPYIELGDDLYRNIGMTIKNPGYYCDGAYFYEQNSSGIIKKELSYTNAIVSEDPLEYEFKNSIRPDSPTLITNFFKLFFLPYTSGKPLPYCGEGVTIYYNVEMSRIVSFDCCDLVYCDDVTLTYPAGLQYSCVSQNEANQKAIDILDQLEAQAIANYDFSTPFSDEETGEIECYFTHELKDETTPTQLSVIFDAREHSTPIIGDALYYDTFGCTKVLDGYYSFSGSTYYRTFLQTVDGVISNVFYMLNSNSTTTTTGQSIITTKRDYSSNWYISGNNSNKIDSYVYEKYVKPKNFDTTQIDYTNLIKGVLKINPFVNYKYEDFQKITGVSQYEEVNSGWYKPLIIWIEEETFYYEKQKTISLRIEEDCSLMTGDTLTRGFHVVGYYDNKVIPTLYPVQLTVTINYSDDSVLVKQVETLPYSPKTYVSLPSDYLTIDSFEISGISPTYLNKISYVDIGTHIPCYDCNLNFSTSVNNLDVSVSVINGTPNYTVTVLRLLPFYYETYTFSTNNFIVTLPSTGTYWLSVEDAINCYKSKTVIAGAPPTPTPTPTPTPVPCAIDAVTNTYDPTSGCNGSFDIKLLGNSTTYDYYLSGSTYYTSGTTINNTIRVFSNLCAGNHKYYALGNFNQGGIESCDITILFTLNDTPPTPTPTRTPAPTPVCELGQQITSSYRYIGNVYLQIYHGWVDGLDVQVSASIDGLSYTTLLLFNDVFPNSYISRNDLNQYTRFRARVKCVNNGVWSNYTNTVIVPF